MHKKLNYVLTVVLLLAIIVVSASPVSAVLTRKKIEVMTGVNIVVDDVKLQPVDSTGKPVEVFVYNGTTYLPVRSVSESLGKPVSWEASTQTVYVGKRSNAQTPTVMLKDLDYFYSTGKFRFLNTVKDNLGQEYSNGINTSEAESSYTYRTDGKYTSFKGRVALNYDSRSITKMGYQLRIFADGILVYSSPEMLAGIDPVDFNVSLTGVLELKVQIIEVGDWAYYDSLLLIDAGLYQ